MKPLVGVVVPVGGRVDLSEWVMAIKSIIDQDYPLDRIRIIQVVRVNDGQPTPIISTTKPDTEIFKFPCFSTAPPTVFEQIEYGYHKARVLGCEFVCVCSANDVMEPFKITDEIYAFQENPEAMVAFGDLVIWDNGDDSVFIDAGFNFDPKAGESYANGMPDVCMIRSSALTDTPFYGSDGEASNDIMFLKMYERYGWKAFVKTSRPNYIYRKHEQALSKNMDMHVKGKRRLVDFLNGYKPLQDAGVSVMLGCSRTPPLETKDIVIQYIQKSEVVDV